eukprot:6186877-Pleurochrysis_carterae.AAC.4
MPQKVLPSSCCKQSRHSYSCIDGRTYLCRLCLCERTSFFELTATSGTKGRSKLAMNSCYKGHRYLLVSDVFYKSAIEC